MAFKSPDHIAPKGTAVNNSSNKKFVLHLDAKFHREFGTGPLHMIDLDCAGGKLVTNFMTLGWVGTGMEGSDFSLKHLRPHWDRFANKSLFTCDVTNR